MEVTFKQLTKFPDNIDPKNVTSFLLGATISITFITLLSMTGILGNQFLQKDNSIDELQPQEAGIKTENMINTRILQPSPNNVSASYVSVETASADGLPNFYKVTMNVTNPSGSQLTEVFTKKDGSLVFLQFPRYIDQERFNSSQYH